MLVGLTKLWVMGLIEERVVWLASCDALRGARRAKARRESIMRVVLAYQWLVAVSLCDLCAKWRSRKVIKRSLVWYPEDEQK